MIDNDKLEMKEVLSFRKGQLSDLPQIVALFREAIAEMDRNNIPQWDEIYPNQEIIEQDIRNNDLYITITEGAISSVFALNRDEDEQYQKGEWKYQNPDYCVIHRICVHPQFQKQRMGTKTLLLIEELLQEQGFKAIHIDVFSLNPYALKMYEALGYYKVGEVQFRKGIFYLMEKGIG